MPTSAKAFFGFLVGAILLSTILGFDGIDRLQRNGASPFGDDLPSLQCYIGTGFIPDKSILFLASTCGKFLVWFSVIFIPICCGIIAFRYDWVFVGYTLLCTIAAGFVWTGLGFWISVRLIYPS
jgi:hypothetical protein